MMPSYSVAFPGCSILVKRYDSFFGGVCSRPWIESIPAYAQHWHRYTLEMSIPICLQGVLTFLDILETYEDFFFY